MKGITLNCTLPVSDFINPESVNEIVDSYTFKGGDWQKKTHLSGFQEGVEKSVIPVDMQFYRLSVLTTVAPGIVVKKHHHDEPIFRYIISGVLNLNGKTYRAGDWVLVPKKHPYEISTEEGYVTLAGYGQACETN